MTNSNHLLLLLSLMVLGVTELSWVVSTRELACLVAVTSSGAGSGLSLWLGLPHSRVTGFEELFCQVTCLQKSLSVTSVVLLAIVL